MSRATRRYLAETKSGDVHCSGGGRRRDEMMMIMIAAAVMKMTFVNTCVWIFLRRTEFDKVSWEGDEIFSLSFTNCENPTRVSSNEVHQPRDKSARTVSAFPNVTLAATKDSGRPRAVTRRSMKCPWGDDGAASTTTLRLAIDLWAIV